MCRPLSASGSDGRTSCDCELDKSRLQTFDESLSPSSQPELSNTALWLATISASPCLEQSCPPVFLNNTDVPICNTSSLVVSRSRPTSTHDVLISCKPLDSVDPTKSTDTHSYFEPISEDTSASRVVSHPVNFGQPHILVVRDGHITDSSLGYMNGANVAYTEEVRHCIRAPSHEVQVPSLPKVSWDWYKACRQGDVDNILTHDLKHTSMNTSNGQETLVTSAPEGLSRTAGTTIEAQYDVKVPQGQPFHNTSNQDEVVSAQTLEYTAETEPNKANATLTAHYLNIFFEFVNVPAFEIFPKYHFIEWAVNGSGKTLPDRIMLYALMAWATVHCDSRDASEHRVTFQRIVYRELDRLETQCCLQVAHILLFMSHAEFAGQRHRAGLDSLTRFVHVMAHLNLNNEQFWRRGTTVYGLSLMGSIECCRRTMWAAVCSGINLRLHNGTSQDPWEIVVPMRLPHIVRDDDSARVSQWFGTKPSSEYDLSTTTRHYSVPNSMAYMIQITQICGEVFSNALLMENDSTNDDGTRSAHRRRDELESRLSCWVEAYSSSHSMEAVPQTGRRGGCGGWTTLTTPMMKYGALDMLYHHARMGLNRRIRHRGLSRKEIHIHARRATLHALEVLRLAQHLLSPRGSATTDYIFVMRGSLTIPILCEAIEVVTAVGKVVDILEPRSQIMSLMYSALDLLEHLGRWWGSDYTRYALIKERVQNVFRSAHTALQTGRSFFYCSHAAIHAVASDCDIVYGTDRKEYLRMAYLGHHPIRDDDIFEIDTSTR